MTNNTNTMALWCTNYGLLSLFLSKNTIQGLIRLEHPVNSIRAYNNQKQLTDNLTYLSDGVRQTKLQVVLQRPFWVLVSRR